MKVIVEEPSPEVDFWLLTTGDGFKLVETGALYIKVSGNKAFNVQDNVLCPMENNHVPCIKYNVEVKFY